VIGVKTTQGPRPHPDQRKRRWADDETAITLCHGRRATQRSAGGFSPFLARVHAGAGRATEGADPFATARGPRLASSASVEAPAPIGELAPAQSGRPVSGSGDRRG
jgi:hypothetical protein